MSRLALAPADARRAALSAGLLASNHDGEVVAAARALCGLLQKGGLDPSAVIAAGLSGGERDRYGAAAVRSVDARRPWRERARRARLSPYLNDWERDFLSDVVGWSSLSARQEATLKAILAKSEGAGR
jgi:hypothetical protein